MKNDKKITILPRSSKLKDFIGDRLKNKLPRGLTVATLTSMLMTMSVNNADAFDINRVLSQTLNGRTVGALVGAALGNKKDSDLERTLKVSAGILAGAIVDEALRSSNDKARQRQEYMRSRPNYYCNRGNQYYRSNFNDRDWDTYNYDYNDYDYYNSPQYGGR